MQRFTKKTLTVGFKTLVGYLKDYKKELVLLSVLGVVSAIANGSAPYLVGKIFDALLAPGTTFDFRNVTFPLWSVFLFIWLITQMIANAVDWVINLKSRKIGTYLNAEAKAKGFSYVLTLPISFHKEHKVGKIGERINKAIEAASDITERVIITLAPEFLTVLVGIAISFIIHPVLALIAIAGVTVYIATLFKIIPPIVKVQRQAHDAWGRAYGDAYDALENVQTIKQAVAERYEAERLYARFVRHSARLWYQVEKIWNSINFYQRITVTVTQLAILALSAYLIINNQLTIGELVAVSSYAGMIFGPFVRLGHNWQTIQNGFVALERSNEIFLSPPEAYNPPNVLPLKKIRGDVVFKNVSFKYQKSKTKILEEVTFEVKAGEVIALVGESGVGKTTLVDLISGYYFPDEGAVLIEGHDLRRLNLSDLRSQIAVVPQEPVLFNDTIRMNIQYGSSSASFGELEEAARKAHALEFIQKFPKKWNQEVGWRGIKLSVGQKQRVAIARAILRDPRILILDEPTSALDAKSEKIIQDSLKELMMGRTTFIIAHRLSTVRHADKIIVLEKGRIAEIGRHDELIQKENGLYRHFYDLQIGLA